MDYETICDVYEELSATTKGLEKTSILARFLKKIKKEPEVIYLLRGRIFPDYDERELGISGQLGIKAIATASGEGGERVVGEWKVLGDLGLVAEKLIGKKKQSSLFSKKLEVKKVMDNLQKLTSLEGRGTVEKKIGLIVELFHSASGKEAKYIIRTVLGDLKVGVGNGLLRDAIVECCFDCCEDLEKKKEAKELVQAAYDKATDFAEVFSAACSGKLNEISLSPGKPIKVMLYPKAKNVEDAFRIVGKPAAFEYKYDGFRMMINKDENGGIKIFTRRLDEVSKQFPEVVEYVKKNVVGKSFILDSEAVGFDPKTKKYQDFQFISQRIKRKYDIERLARELPIELRIFDVIFYNGKSLIEKSFGERGRVLKKIVKEIPWKIMLAEQIVTDDEKVAEEFYKKSLEDNQEGLMVKGLDKKYKPGARIGYAVKLKPEDNDFDLGIIGAEWGTGKRAGWLTSFDIACRNAGGELLGIGKVSTGLKEKEEEGLSFKEMTEKLKKIILEEDGRKIKVKPEIVVSVQYQNIQKSPTYSSGYALRFPRILRLREDRGISDIATIDEVEKEIKE